MRVAQATLAAAWREAWANRRGFWLQVGIMSVNDLGWIVFWAFFFGRVDDVKGWDFDRLMVLFAILATAAGIVLGLLNNSRRIGELASTGGLDAALALPTSPLAHVLCRRVEAANVGDLFFGIGCFLVLGQPTVERAVVFVFGVACAVLILGGFLVAVGSLSFYVSRNEASDLGFHAMLLFANYPVDIFSGATKIFLYAVVPAGFVTSVPALLVDDFDPRWAVGMLAVALTVAFLGWLTFTVGLRRYTSGAVWTAA